MDYGMFVLVQSSITLMLSAQGAWLQGPLSVVAPAKSGPVRRQMVGAIEQSQRRFLRMGALACLLIPIAGLLLHVWTGLECLVIAMGVLACWTALQRDYFRCVLMIYTRPQAMFNADLIYVVVLVAGALLAAFGPAPAVVWATGALIAAALAGEYFARLSLSKDPGFVGGDARPFWAEMRPLAVWGTIGAMTYWVYNQSYNYVLASRIDLMAVANVNAARLILMPTIVLTVGVKTLLVPTAARWLAETDIGRLIRRLLLFASGVAVLDLIYCMVVWVGRDWLSHDLMHKTIADRDRLLILWAILSFIALYRDLLQTGLFALRSFRPLAAVTAVSAVVSLSLMWYGIKVWGAAAALIGQVAGESVNLLGVLLLLVLAYRDAKRRPSQPANS